LQRNGVEMQHVVRGQNKNLTESLLALQAMYTVAVYPNLTGVVIVSGDGDYLALVNQLKTRGLSVIGVGADGNANSSWSRNCDEYLVCNAAAPAPAEKKSSSKAAAATIPASEKNQIISTLKELIPVNGILLPDLEDKLKENHPDFAPENYHFRDLSEFLQSLGNDYVAPLQGFADGVIPDPGRCPGLVCHAPLQGCGRQSTPSLFVLFVVKE
jgi:hypothetical protein